VPGFDVKAARLPFDPRWTLFFTPHSAHLDRDLLKQARSSIYWTDGLTLGTPEKIRQGARAATEAGVTGFLPSLEPFNCKPNPKENVLKPFHFQWLRDGEMPLNELLMRVNRIAYREFSRHPTLEWSAFKKVLGNEIFGKESKAVEDLLFVQESYFLEADWFLPSPMIARSRRQKWDQQKAGPYRKRAERAREIARRYEGADNMAERELGRIAAFIAEQWTEK
jgi:hypothetical protein